MTYYNKTSYWI